MDARNAFFFEEMKALMAAEVLCAYPDHNKPFKIYTDASNYQLGACIMQDNRPVAYYSRKLNSAQCNYATIDKELLCVVATLREFQSMLLGAALHVYTDNQNILNVGNLSEQQLRWISCVDEYGPTIHYIEGPCNFIVDVFSRLSCKDVPSTLVGKNAAHIVSNSKLDSLYLSLIDDEEILQYFLNLPCCFLNKKKEKRPKKLRKCSADTHSLAYDGNNHF
jgi:hypothetical protein